MITVVDTDIREGYTPYDHLIDQADRNAIRYLIGRQFRSASAALQAAEAAFLRCCDRRVTTARVQICIVSDRRYPTPVWIG